MCRLNYHLIIVEPPTLPCICGGLGWLRDRSPSCLPGNMSLSAIRATTQSPVSSPPPKSKGFYISCRSVVENLPASEEDVGPTPGLGRSDGEGKATHSSIRAWEVPRTEEPGKLQFAGSQKSWTRLSD